jgi:hypothetical protein
MLVGSLISTFSRCTEAFSGCGGFALLLERNSFMEPEHNEDDLRDWLLVTAGHLVVIGISATYLLW